MLEVRLLGQFDVRRDGKTVVIPARAAQSLFAYLILTAGSTHRREKLAGLIWPETTEENARKNLRNELWRLRAAIETKTPRKQEIPYFLVDEISIAFNAESDYWLDTRIMQIVPTKQVSADNFIETLSPYRGELLPGFYSDWVVFERERVRALFDQKMVTLLGMLIEERRWQDVLVWGERWIGLGQTPEPAFRALMTAHSAIGNKAKVASVYQRCVTALRNDLSVDPSEETVTLFEQLSKGERRSSLPENPTPVATLEASAPPSRLTNLPVPLTSFIGREKELDEIGRLLSSSRLLTLTGPGGVGKTRSAVQIANQSSEKFDYGVWWVDIASLVDDALVPQAIAHALNVPGLSNQPMKDALANFLHNKQLLLVLDNCEHLIDACARICEQLLSACPSLKILATSREALGITGESLYEMPTLSLPEGQILMDAESLMQYEGIRLFVERAQAVKSDFALNERNAAAVLEICRRLDGIPLALELAATRTKLLSVEHITERLNDRFNLLTRGSRTALPRQQTLRAAIDWSYDLLAEDARILFRRLSVFVGGFTLEAAEGVCSEGPLTAQAMLDQLTRLVDRSLVKVERKGNYERYRMLETIREYALEKLDENGETERMRRRHLDFFVEFSEQAEQKLKGDEQFEWLDRLELEHDNSSAAWECAIQADAELALRLASALLDFWVVHLNPSEGRTWLAQLLPRTEHWGQTGKRAHVLAIAGQLAYSQRDFASARSLLEQALATARVAGDEKEIALALLCLGRTAHRQGDDQTAKLFTEECLAIYQGLDDRWGIAMTIFLMAAVAAAHGHYAEAESRYMESLTKFQELGDKVRAGYVINGLGELARLLGDYERAGKFYEEGVEILRRQRSPVVLVTPLVNLGWVPLRRGDFRKANTLFGESLKLSTEYGNKNGLAMSLAGIAGILGMIGKSEQAARLFGAVESLLESFGMAGRMDPSDQKEFDHYIAAVRAHLGEAEFPKAWKEGRALTLEQAVALATDEKLHD